jgi:hypothetical protein
LAIFKTDETNPRLFISTLPNFAEKLRETKKGVVFIGETFFYGILGNPTAYDFATQFQPLMYDHLVPLSCLQQHQTDAISSNHPIGLLQ